MQTSSNNSQTPEGNHMVLKQGYTASEKQLDSFERYLTQYPKDQRQAFIDVADAAFMCLQWFRAQDIEPGADAIVAMAGLVLQREPTIA